MRVEVLFPEIANLYGELGNIRYLEKSVPGVEIKETYVNEKPAFLDAGCGDGEGFDLVYMGTMSESSQLLVMDKLAPYRDELISSIEGDQRILVTGNALEIFGKFISDDTGEKQQCMGIFGFHTERKMMKRFNSLYLGKYGDIDVVGYKSQFTHSFYDDENLEPLFMTKRGPGFNPEVKEEGIRYKNFMATYVIGPLFILNPPLMTEILREAGTDVKPAFEEAAMDAYRSRVAEYSNPKTGFYY